MFMTAQEKRCTLLVGAHVRNPIEYDGVRVYVTRQARQALAKLSPPRRQQLTEGFIRVGRQLLSSAEHVVVQPEWARKTSPRRRYPQQCYAKTVKYVLDHPGIEGLRLMHGVVSHAPRFIPLDHAWVELPGEVVFDGVVQTFFTRDSYLHMMRAVVLDDYSAADVRRLVSDHGYPGPWNAKWVPTAAQIDAYDASAGFRRSRPFRARESAARHGSAGWHAPPPPLPAGRTPGRSPRRGSSGPQPLSPGP
jgi:hypothetical protein